MNELIATIEIKNLQIIDLGIPSVPTYKESIEVNHAKTIIFETNHNFSMGILIYQNLGTWHPACIFHHPDYEAGEESARCPFCRKFFFPESLCRAFETHLQEIFELVMNHQTIRIKKIFF